MSHCPECAHENQPGASFCSACGVAISADEATAREERKIVTVLFADLVGFTSRSEQLDPEDVRALLSPYYARLRLELERFGGTVEKFIGDAVMALFGAPIAHEDDPERAVRAALAIRDWVLDQPGGLQLRIAVNTGEVLVALGARPSRGEGMASGDVVNTTARLQTAAPVNGILVGEVTHRATAQLINYRAAEPVAAKGKAERVAVWEALEARSRLGSDLASASRTPLVGRDHELRVLSDALARVRRERAPQLLTIAGVPGIGKSRMVSELFRAVDADPSALILWRQGRSLPYGDGVTLWALAEMVKAQAGILETDTTEQASAKLHMSVAALISDPGDANWVEGHLRPLAGVAGDDERGGAQRDEAFAAWRRFFERLADDKPLTLVFEDLHWADDNLLDFIEYLVEWVERVPLLVICTARPELFERRAGWSGGHRNATTISLAPLGDDDTARLIDVVRDRPVMPVETQQALLALAGGNPLYAEQYVYMVAERGAETGLPLPETVQGIIAARIDALPLDEKAVLQNAAVMGKVFWLGSVVEIGQLDPRAAEARLHALERKDFVQRARRSTVADEAEYSVLHVLVRDAAYAQIPRAQRAEKHRVAAEWIASLGRIEDHAEMLAHHYLRALELQRAAGQRVDDLVAVRALEVLKEAGQRALSLNAYASAATFYGSALEVAKPTGVDVEHAQIRCQLGLARWRAGDLDRGMADLESGIADLERLDALAECGKYQLELAEAYWHLGEWDRAAKQEELALTVLEPLGPSEALAQAYANVAWERTNQFEGNEAAALAQRAMETAKQLPFDVQTFTARSAHAGALICLGRVAEGIELFDRTYDEEVARGMLWLAEGACRNRILYRMLNLRASEVGPLVDIFRSSSLRPETGLWLLWFDTWCLHACGRMAEASTIASDFLEQAERAHVDGWAKLARACVAMALIDSDYTQDALRLVESGLDHETLNRWEIRDRWWLRMRACLGTSDPHGALDVAEQVLSAQGWNLPASLCETAVEAFLAAELVEKAALMIAHPDTLLHSPDLRPYLDRAEGRLAMARGDAVLARWRLQDAADGFAAAKEIPEQLRTLVPLARAQAACADPASAATTLKEVIRVSRQSNIGLHERLAFEAGMELGIGVEVGRSEFAAGTP